MADISRERMEAGTQAVRTIQSITFARKGDKIVNRCVQCEAETASHRGQRFCNACDANVATYKSIEAKAGDIVRMQFIPRINPAGTKNWTPSGGFMFNAKTRAEAEAIKQRNRLIQCLKMGEQMPDETADADARAMIDSGDMKALPRCFGSDTVLTWTAEGVTYTVVD